MKISEMINMTIDTFNLYKSIIEKPWNIEAMIIELTGEVGTLADIIMIKEKYRKLRENQEIDIADSVVDIMFILICIAHYYNVDLETAYKKMIIKTKEKIQVN
jgi:NTP pyrophosphatase (non-canonical NTP hydrolase)